MKNMLKLSAMTLAIVGFVSTGFSAESAMGKPSMDSTKVVTEGSKLTIINENPQSLTLEITPVNSDSKAMHKIEVQGKETKEFVINAAMLDGNTVYKVKLSTNAMLSDDCKDLSVLKPYTITALNGSLKTKCFVTESAKL